MRISDWSSDVCSSDLLPHGEAGAKGPVGTGDTNAFIILNTGTLTFDDAHADAERVARAEIRNGLFGLEFLDGFSLERLDEIRDPSSFFFFSCAPEGDWSRAPIGPFQRSGRLSRVRTEVRREGKGGRGTCSSRWSPLH